MSYFTLALFISRLTVLCLIVYHLIHRKSIKLIQECPLIANGSFAKAFSSQSQLTLFTTFDFDTYLTSKPDIEQDASAKYFDVCDDDLVNDVALLKDEDFAKPEKYDLQCGVDQKQRKKRPCANCTCGIVEQIDAESAALAKEAAPKSSCGSVIILRLYYCPTTILKIT